MLDQLTLAAMNFLIERSPWAGERLRRFAGREARLVVPPILLVDFRVGPEGQFEPALGTGPDVEIALPPHGLFALLGGPDALMSSAQITGSADFAEGLGFVLRHLEWDAEEDLSRVFGDIVAYRLAAFGRAFAGAQLDAVRRLGENAVEYLQYESPQLASRAEIEMFRDNVTRLRDDTQRLEQAMTRLEFRLNRSEARR